MSTSRCEVARSASRRRFPFPAGNNFGERHVLVGKPVRRIVNIVDLALRVRFLAARNMFDHAIVFGRKIRRGFWKRPREVHPIDPSGIGRLTSKCGNKEQTNRHDEDQNPHETSLRNCFPGPVNGGSQVRVPDREVPSSLSCERTVAMNYIRIQSRISFAVKI